MSHLMLKPNEGEPELEGTPAAPNPKLDLLPRPLLRYRELQPQSLIGSILGNLKDALFPRRLPPLALTSRPVKVRDPMKEKHDSTSGVVSAIIHLLVIAFVIWATTQIREHQVVPEMASSTVSTPIYMPPVAPPAPTVAKGGGGAPHVVKQERIHLPRYEKLNMSAHEILHTQQPRRPRPAPPSVEMAMNAPDAALPTLGNPVSPNVALRPQTSGSGSGIGQGLGSGIGAGSGGGFGSGIMSVGGGVSAPRLTHSVQPDFTNQARQAKRQGVVGIELIVDRNGDPEDIHVIHHLGMGLDQKAVEAVQQYRFKPAMYHGHPVAVRLIVDVQFRLY